ncbi:MAG: TIGR03790 family protein [Steroidobacteraceae bacterium]
MILLALLPCLQTVSYANTRASAGNALAVVYNRSDHESVAIAHYYRQRRRIPARNLVAVDLPTGKDSLTAQEFSRLDAQLTKNLPLAVQFVLFAWSRPFRVECNSLTAAFTLGFQPKLCANGCTFSRVNPLYDSDIARPYDRLGMRPSMLLAASDLIAGRALVDRGVQADASQPTGTAYLLKGPDRNRAVREPTYSPSRSLARPNLKVAVIEGVSIKNRPDVMFYFSGAIRVPDIPSNRFLPGAIADHLTSSGGNLFGTAQMSALRWLDGGATASYGTVSEPCAYPQKFPSIPVLIRHYLAGEPLILAYWKSVAMPAQGLFVGEPMARPYARN